MAVIKTVNLKNVLWSSCGLALLVILSALVSVSIGSIQISLSEIICIVLHKIGFVQDSSTEVLNSIVLNIRLPRVFLAMIVGGSLSVAGVIFQVLLKNALAEPYILGISSGASVGALAAIVSGLATMFIGAISLCAFIGAITVVVCVYAIGNRRGILESGSLLLSGVMIGAFLSAVILLLVMISGDNIRNSFFWLLGNLSMQKGSEIYFLFPVIISSVIIFITFAKKYNMIALGDEIAETLGVKLKNVRNISYLLASLMTGIVVSMSGAIGFIGLIVPHSCRLIFGPDHRILIPTSFLMGSLFLILADTLARTILFPLELPVGAITAMIGAPLFLILMKMSD